MIFKVQVHWLMLSILWTFHCAEQREARGARPSGQWPIDCLPQQEHIQVCDHFVTHSNSLPPRTHTHTPIHNSVLLTELLCKLSVVANGLFLMPSTDAHFDICWSLVLQKWVIHTERLDILSGSAFCYHTVYYTLLYQGNSLNNLFPPTKCV